jgi:uncharacterized membrane protein YqjE
MAIAETLGRMMATLLAIIRTRVELAVVEMKEESLRLLSYLVLSLLALLCFAIAILLGTFFVIVLFWDTHRIASILITAGVHIALGVGIGLGIRSSIRHKPKLLSYTIAELRKDVDSVNDPSLKAGA